MEIFIKVLEWFFMFLVAALAVGYYFYKKRYTVTETIEDDKYEIEKVDSSSVAHRKNKTFPWDLPKEDLKEENDFIGFTQWESKDLAETRIAELKESLDATNGAMLFMIEILFLLEEHGDKIHLKENGDYAISKYYLYEFVDSLEYGSKLVSKLTRLRDGYIEKNKDMEINAKTIFFIMKNAKNFGMHNIKNEVHFFNFVNTKANEIEIDAAPIDIENNKLRVSGDDEMSLHSTPFDDDDFNEEKVKSKIDSLAEVMKETFTSEVKDGLTYVKVEGGLEYVKRGPWEVIEVLTEQDRLDMVNASQEDKNKMIYQENMRVAGEVAADTDFQKDGILKDGIIKEKNKKTENKVVVDKEKIVIPKKVDSLFIVPEYEKLFDFPMVYAKKSEDFFGCLGEVETIEQYKEKLIDLGEDNLNKIIHIAMENITGNNYVTVGHMKMYFNFFLTDGKRFYVMYEYFIYILLLMIQNKDNFTKNVLLFNEKSFSMKYPSSLVDAFLETYSKFWGYNLVYFSNEKNYGYRAFESEGKLFKANLMLLDFSFIQTKPTGLEKARKVKMGDEVSSLISVTKKEDVNTLSLKHFKHEE